MRGGDPGQPVGQVPARSVDRGDLQVLGVGVVHLAVAGDDLPLDLLEAEQRLLGQRVHALDQRPQVAPHDEVGAVALERLDRSGRARGQPGLEHVAHALVGEIGVLLRARERELLLDDLLREHEPCVVVAGAHDVRQGAEGVEAREQRDR